MTSQKTANFDNSANQGKSGQLDRAVLVPRRAAARLALLAARRRLANERPEVKERRLVVAIQLDEGHVTEPPGHGRLRGVTAACYNKGR